MNCQQKFIKQSNASRHIKNCKGEKQAVYHTHSVCSKVFLKRHIKSHKKSAMDDNFVPSLAFEPADQVLPDQIVEEFSLSGLNLKKDSVENNTEIENRS